jgi:hypothetical protein
MGKSFAKLSVKRQEAGRSAKRLLRIFGQTVIHAVFGHHFRDGVSAAFIPYLLKPATH